MEHCVFACPRRALLPILWLALGFCSLSREMQAQGMDFYVYNQGNVQAVKNGDPEQVKPEYWTVWIFYDHTEGHALQGTKCGAEDGKTAAVAAENAKKLLDFNLRWAKFIYGSAWEQNLTSCSGRNILGPIAVMGQDVPWNPARIPDNIREAYEQIRTARETWNQIKDVLDISDPRVGPKDDNPYEHVGSVLKEYTKNLQSATSLFNQLASGVLNGATLRGMGDVIGQLNDAMEALRSARKFAALEMPELGKRTTVADVQPSDSRCPGATWSEARKSCVCPALVMWDKATNRCEGDTEVYINGVRVK